MAFHHGDLSPIKNPSVPMIRSVPRPLQIGQRIRITGAVRPHGNRFHVNLSLGAALADVPTALHFNPRFDVDEGKEPYVVRNSYLAEKWGTEEKKGEMPFEQGRHFDIVILVQSDCYKILVNGNVFCEFVHRIFLDDVSHLVIDGDVTLDCISFEGEKPGMRPPLPGEDPSAGPDYSKFPVPYNTKLSNAMYPGKIIYISGMPLGPEYDRFEINFMYTKETNIDVALHFNPRFELQKVVRNTLKGVTWMKEDRSEPKPPKYAKGEKHSFPFQPARHFDIVIIVEEDKYNISVNNQHYCDYEHKIKDLKRIKFMEISGDVRISTAIV